MFFLSKTTNKTCPRGHLFRQITAMFVVFVFIFVDAVRYAPQGYASPVAAGADSASSPFSISKELGSIDEVYHASRDSYLGPNTNQSQRSGDWGRPNDRSEEEMESLDGTRATENQNEDAVPSPESRKTIIFIQDAHDSLEAQENIAKLIGKFVKEKGIKTVFEEGYEGPVPTDKFFGFIKDPKTKQKVSYFLLDKLRVGGAEYAHINRTSDFKLIGVEDLKLYGENIKCYQESSRNRKDIEEDLGELFSRITVLANQYFPKDLKSWLKRKELFSEGKLPLLNYLRELRGLSLRGAPQGDAAIALYPNGIASLSARNDTVNKGDPSTYELVSRKFAKEYPAISILLQVQTAHDPDLIRHLNALDSKEVFEEITQLETELSNDFLQDERDRQIFTYYQGLNILKRLSRIELTQAEYAAAQGVLQNLKTQKMADLIVSLTHRSLVLSKEWEQHIQDAIRFYGVAYGRERSVDSRLREFLQSKEDTAILVFGGFHTSGIKEILKQQGLSYVVISPRITSIDKTHQDYYKQLMSMGQHSFEAPFLAARANKPPSVFFSAAVEGNEAPVRSELRAIASSVEGLGDHADSQLIERGLASSQAQSMNVATGISRSRSEIREEKIEAFQRELGIDREALAKALLKHPPLAGLIPSRVRDEWKEELGIDREALAKAILKNPQLAGLSMQDNIKPKVLLLRRLGIPEAVILAQLSLIISRNVWIVLMIERIALSTNSPLASAWQIVRIYERLNNEVSKLKGVTAGVLVRKDPNELDLTIQPILQRLVPEMLANSRRSEVRSVLPSKAQGWREALNEFLENDREDNLFRPVTVGKLATGVVVTFLGMAVSGSATGSVAFFASFWIVLTALRNMFVDLRAYHEVYKVWSPEAIRKSKLSNDLMFSGLSSIPIVLSKIYLSNGAANYFNWASWGNVLADIVVVTIVGGIPNYYQRLLRKYPGKVARWDFWRSLVMSLGAYGFFGGLYLLGGIQTIIPSAVAFAVARKVIGEGWAAYSEYDEITDFFKKEKAKGRRSEVRAERDDIRELEERLEKRKFRLVPVEGIPAHLKGIEERYGLGKVLKVEKIMKSRGADDLEMGFIFHTANGVFFVKKMYVAGSREALGAEEARYVAAYVKHLQGQGIPIQMILQEKGQDLLMEVVDPDTGRPIFYTVEKEVRGKQVFRDKAGTEELKKAAQKLAEIHSAGRSWQFTAPKDLRHYDMAENAKGFLEKIREAEFRPAMTRTLAPEDQRLVTGVLEETIPVLLKTAQSLHKEPIMSDFNFSNMIFSEDLTKIAGIFDMDQARMGYRFEEFLPLLFFGAIDLKLYGDHAAEELAVLVKAYQEAAADPLSPAEIDALPNHCLFQAAKSVMSAIPINAASETEATRTKRRVSLQLLKQIHPQFSRYMGESGVRYSSAFDSSAWAPAREESRMESRVEKISGMFQNKFGNGSGDPLIILGEVLKKELNESGARDPLIALTGSASYMLEETGWDGINDLDFRVHLEKPVSLEDKRRVVEAYVADLIVAGIPAAVEPAGENFKINIKDAQGKTYKTDIFFSENMIEDMFARPFKENHDFGYVFRPTDIFMGSDTALERLRSVLTVPDPKNFRVDGMVRYYMEEVKILHQAAAAFDQIAYGKLIKIVKIMHMLACFRGVEEQVAQALVGTGFISFSEAVLYLKGHRDRPLCERVFRIGIRLFDVNGNEEGRVLREDLQKSMNRTLRVAKPIRSEMQLNPVDASTAQPAGTESRRAEMRRYNAEDFERMSSLIRAAMEDYLAEAEPPLLELSKKYHFDIAAMIVIFFRNYLQLYGHVRFQAAYEKFSREARLDQQDNELCKRSFRHLVDSPKDIQAEPLLEAIIKAAAHYDALASYHSLLNNPKSLPSLRDAKTYLDLASGPNFPQFFPTLDPDIQYTAVDLDETTYVEHYLKAAGDLFGVKNVEFRKADLTTADFDKETFDVVRAKNVSPYVPRVTEHQWRKILGAVKKGGVFIVQTDHGNPGQRMDFVLKTGFFETLFVSGEWTLEYREGSARDPFDSLFLLKRKGEAGENLKQWRDYILKTHQRIMKEDLDSIGAEESARWVSIVERFRQAASEANADASSQKPVDTSAFEKAAERLAQDFPVGNRSHISFMMICMRYGVDVPEHAEKAFKQVLLRYGFREESGKWFRSETGTGSARSETRQAGKPVGEAEGSSALRVAEMRQQLGHLAVAKSMLTHFYNEKDLPRIYDLGQKLVRYVNARQIYDAGTNSYRDLNGDQGLLAEGPFDTMMVFGSGYLDVPKEAARIALELRKQNPEMKVMAVGNYGADQQMGGRFVINGKRVSEAEYFKEVMKRRGVLPDFLGISSTNTKGNVTESHNVANENGLHPKRIVIVSILHRRAGPTLTLHYPTSGESLATLGIEKVATWSPEINLDEWRRDEALAAIKDAVNEVGKITEYSQKDPPWITPTSIPSDITTSADELHKLLNMARSEVRGLPSFSKILSYEGNRESLSDPRKWKLSALDKKYYAGMSQWDGEKLGTGLRAFFGEGVLVPINDASLLKIQSGEEFLKKFIDHLIHGAEQDGIKGTGAGMSHYWGPANYPPDGLIARTIAQRHPEYNFQEYRSRYRALLIRLVEHWDQLAAQSVRSTKSVGRRAEMRSDEKQQLNEMPGQIQARIPRLFAEFTTAEALAEVARISQMAGPKSLNIREALIKSYYPQLRNFLKEFLILTRGGRTNLSDAELEDLESQSLHTFHVLVSILQLKNLGGPLKVDAKDHMRFEQFFVNDPSPDQNRARELIRLMRGDVANLVPGDLNHAYELFSLAAMVHDIGKFEDHLNHEIVGARLIGDLNLLQPLVERGQISAEDAQLIKAAVRHHILLGNIASGEYSQSEMKSVFSDPETLSYLSPVAGRIDARKLERLLRFIFILSEMDTAGVAPTKGYSTIRKANFRRSLVERVIQIAYQAQGDLGRILTQIDRFAEEPQNILARVENGLIYWDSHIDQKETGVFLKAFQTASDEIRKRDRVAPDAMDLIQTLFPRISIKWFGDTIPNLAWSPIAAPSFSEFSRGKNYQAAVFDVPKGMPVNPSAVKMLALSLKARKLYGGDGRILMLPTPLSQSKTFEYQKMLWSLEIYLRRAYDVRKEGDECFFVDRSGIRVNIPHAKVEIKLLENHDLLIAYHAASVETEQNSTADEAVGVRSEIRGESKGASVLQEPKQKLMRKTLWDYFTEPTRFWFDALGVTSIGWIFGSTLGFVFLGATSLQVLLELSTDLYRSVLRKKGAPVW
jgi:Ser/Thr protein kinase RdoA (MazF antagonist)/SAM-dependent methyltransferase